MANLDRPKGFEPYGKLQHVGVYESGSACYPGDMVALASDGQVDPATAGNPVLGLCLSYASAAGQQIAVADDPNQQFVAQGDETEFDVQSDIGNMCDLLATAGSTAYKTSRQELDSSTSSASQATFQILSLERGTGNSFGTNAQVMVRVNEHQLAQGSGIAGV